MELKPYQARVIQDLDTYLTLVDQTQDYVQAYNQFWNDKGFKVGWLDTTAMPPYKDTIHWCPHVCVKVPTAWGKTFIATNAIKTITDHQDLLKHKVVVWLVPGDTILQQTVGNLNNPNHPYRQKLDLLFQHRVQVYTKDQILQWASFSLDTLKNQLSIIVMSYDTFRSQTKDNRKIYEDNSNLTSFASLSPSGTAMTDDISAMNVLNRLNPIVVVDEAHNTTSDLSIKMLQDLNPCCIFDLTATPRENSNIISYVSALELKKEEMIKLPLVVYNQSSMDEVVLNTVHFQAQLEQITLQNQAQWWAYIRPIALFQAQPKWWDNDDASFYKIKEKLIKKWIPEEQIKIKTSKINEIKNTDLLDPSCPVRFIITINALKEWWDCPFAYILASLANKSSDIDVTQIVGRILRQPYARRTKHDLLNCSYVFTASDKFSDVLQSVVQSLNAWGYTNKLYYDDTIHEDEYVIGVNSAPETHSIFDNPPITLEKVETADVREELTDEVITAQNQKDIATTISDQAQQQINSFKQVIASMDVEDFAFAPELQSKQNHYSMKQSFESAHEIKIPQFMIKVPNNSFFEDSDGKKLLEKVDCLDGFILQNQSSDIIFDTWDNNVFQVDVTSSWSHQYAPEYSKMSSKATKSFISYIAQQSDEIAIKSVANLVFDKLRTNDHINEQDLKSYIQRALANLTTDQIAELKENPYKYSSKIQQKIQSLENNYKKQTFSKYFDIDKVNAVPSYQLPKSINLSSTTSGITKSLYMEEGEMNKFEHKVIVAIANLEEVEWRHRNIERSGFCINGWINHYPDFIVKMKSWTILIIETKWDDRDNGDSKDKVLLWEYRANQPSLTWIRYKYMMIFDENPVDKAYTFAEALDRIKSM